MTLFLAPAVLFALLCCAWYIEDRWLRRVLMGALLTSTVYAILREALLR